MKKQLILGAAIFVASVAAGVVEYRMLAKTLNLIHLWGVICAIMAAVAGIVGIADNIGYRKEGGL